MDGCDVTDIGRIIVFTLGAGALLTIMAIGLGFLWQMRPWVEQDLIRDAKKWRDSVKNHEH